MTLFQTLTIPFNKTETSPPNLEGFVFIQLEDSLLIYGGKSNSNPEPNKIFLFDLSKNEWSSHETKGDIPPNISYPAYWYDPPKYVFIHGGKVGNKSSDETYLLDLETHTWRKIFSVQHPTSRYGHCAVVRNEEKQAYIFGGAIILKEKERYHDNINRFEFKSIRVVEGESGSVNGASWICSIQTKGDKPPGRKGHSLAYIEENNSLIVFGGETQKGINDNSLYVFNIDDKEWKKLQIKNSECIAPRAFHNMALINNNLFIYGGKLQNGDATNEIITFDIANETATQLVSDNNEIPKRYCGAISECNDGVKWQLFIIGGKQNENEYLNMDIFLINFKTNLTEENIPESLTNEQQVMDNDNDNDNNSFNNNIEIDNLPQENKVQSLNESPEEIQQRQNKLNELMQLHSQYLTQYSKYIEIITQNTNLQHHQQHLLLQKHLELNEERFRVVSELMRMYISYIEKMDRKIIEKIRNKKYYPLINYNELSQIREHYKKKLHKYYLDMKELTEREDRKKEQLDEE